MAKRQKVDITDDQFKEAIAWLDNGGTKKGACDILGVGNNKTMEARIEEWKDMQETAARLRKEKRKTACSPQERANLIESYFDGDTFKELSDRYYRSVAYIKHILELSGALIRSRGEKNPLSPPLLPEECVLLEPDFRVRERISMECASLAEFETRKVQVFKEKGLSQQDVVEVRSYAGKWNTTCALDIKGEVVWLPGYQCLAEVVREVPTKQEGKAYQLYLLEQDHHQFVNVMYWDIGSLRHLEELGAKLSSRGTYTRSIECIEAINKALKLAKKQES